MPGLGFGLILLIISSASVMTTLRTRRSSSNIGNTRLWLDWAAHWGPPVIATVSGFTAIWLLLATSYVIVDADEVGHLNRI